MKRIRERNGEILPPWLSFLEYLCPPALQSPDLTTDGSNRKSPNKWFRVHVLHSYINWVMGHLVDPSRWWYLDKLIFIITLELNQRKIWRQKIKLDAVSSQSSGGQKANFPKPMISYYREDPLSFLYECGFENLLTQVPINRAVWCLWEIFLIVSSIMINTLKPERIIMMKDVCPRWKVRVVARCKTYTWQGEGLAMNRIERRAAKWRIWSWRGFFLSYFCLLIVRAGWF